MFCFKYKFFTILKNASNLNFLKSFSSKVTSERVNLYGGLWPESFVALNNIKDNPGSTKQRRRVGRGIGSGRGKTCGRGHKGQKARGGGRKPRAGFEGGQTPISLRFPKKGFKNPNSVEWTNLNLYHLQESIKKGILDTNEIITMKKLRDTGIVGKKIKHGIKILGHGADKFLIPNLHLQEIIIC